MCSAGMKPIAGILSSAIIVMLAGGAVAAEDRVAVVNPAFLGDQPIAFVEWNRDCWIPLKLD